MKRIVVVEDESLVRLGICSMIEKRNTEYKVVGETDNGTRAIAIILENMPDMVLLDITIPGANGLEVLRKIRGKGYQGYVMMLTCHEDFQLAQQAIRLGANDYVLKTEIDGENLFSYLDKVTPANKKAAEVAQEAYLQAKRENFLNNLFMVGIENEAEFDRARQDYGLLVNRTGLYFFLVRIQNYSDIITRYEREEQDMFFTAVASLLGESLGSVCKHQIIRFSPENYIVLASFGNGPSMQERQRTLATSVAHIHSNIETFLNMDVLVCVSSEIRQVSSINTDFERIICLLDRPFFFPEEKTIWDKVPLNSTGFSVVLAELKKRLQSIVNQKEEPESFDAAIQDFLQSCRPANILPDKAAFLYAMQDFSSSFSQHYSLEWRPFEPQVTLKQLLAHVKELLSAATLDEKPQNYLAAQAMRYIDEHFAQDIPLDDIAENIGISTSYLSRIFTRTMGKNISAYITEKRIQHAQNLITTTSLKHYEIAEKCGLNSSAYFTTTFKKHTGMTPNQYRNQIK